MFPTFKTQSEKSILPNNTDKKRIIIDYMAGQTDTYFLRECEYNFKEFNRDELYR